MEMDCSAAQPSKAQSPIYVTLFGMEMDCSAAQPQNAQFPICVTLFGMEMDCSAAQPLNAPDPIERVMNNCLLVSWYNMLLRENVLFPIFLMLSEMEMDCSAAQSLNAESPIRVTLLGMWIHFTFVFPSYARSLIFVVPAGISMSSPSA